MSQFGDVTLENGQTLGDLTPRIGQPLNEKTLAYVMLGANAANQARFIANPTGNSVTLTANGATVTAQDGQSTYVSNVTTGEVIEVIAKGVKNAYGNSGDDTLTGSAEANWLVGGLGSDTFYAGAGDDILIVDADGGDWRMAA